MGSAVSAVSATVVSAVSTGSTVAAGAVVYGVAVFGLGGVRPADFKGAFRRGGRG